MSTVFIKNNKQFESDESLTILESAKRAGIFLEYSCLSGRCGACKTKLLDGATEITQHEDSLSAEELADGFILSCCRAARSDLHLAIEDLGDYNISATRTLPAKIDGIEFLADDVISVCLRLAPNSHFNFLPGQYINISKRDIKRSYSVANNAREDQKIELQIKKYDNGIMSHYWFSEAKKNDLLMIEGPLGTFFLRHNIASTIVFLATGTGIAPIKAILEQIEKHPERYRAIEFLVFWGGRTAESIYWKPGLSMNNIRFIPVLSRAGTDWTGERGYVQEVALRYKNDLTDTQVYACGSDAMIHSARNLFLVNGLLESNFFADAFVSSN